MDSINRLELIFSIFAFIPFLFLLFLLSKYGIGIFYIFILFEIAIAVIGTEVINEEKKRVKRGEY